MRMKKYSYLLYFKIVKDDTNKLMQTQKVVFQAFIFFMVSKKYSLIFLRIFLMLKIILS